MDPVKILWLHDMLDQDAPSFPQICRWWQHCGIQWEDVGIINSLHQFQLEITFANLDLLQCICPTNLVDPGKRLERSGAPKKMAPELCARVFYFRFGTSYLIILKLTQFYSSCSYYLYLTSFNFYITYLNITPSLRSVVLGSAKASQFILRRSTSIYVALSLLRRFAPSVHFVHNLLLAVVLLACSVLHRIYKNIRTSYYSLRSQYYVLYFLRCFSSTTS